MSSPRDVEAGREYKSLEPVDSSVEEEQSLLPGRPHLDQEKLQTQPPTSRYNLVHLISAFAIGIVSCILTQVIILSSFPSTRPNPGADIGGYFPLGSPDVGSTERHPYPPTAPSNADPTKFPTHVGYVGATPTGAEAGLVATAPFLPKYTEAPSLFVPTTADGVEKGKKFNMLRSWGNLSPWYSNDRGVFGLDSGPESPEGCSVTGLHFLHRHGARYPTAWSSWAGPAAFATRLHKDPTSWKAKGPLDFLNNWTYKLGEEVLTPFGRQQLFDLGVSMRMRYGYLLKNFSDSNTIPVFRTESQHRMHHSAMNFAIGFFGYPTDGLYQQEVTIEASGFNNTLAPYETCPNAGKSEKSDRGTPYLKKWTSVYLKNTQKRLQSQLHGYELTIEDVYTMQQLCAYETVALGYSKFCELFTVEEWEGFEYALDLIFWYNSAFGSPVGRIQGVGYMQELVARLTHTPIQTHNSSTNGTLDDDPITFPLDHSLYVDATHEVVVLNVITALNLTTLAKTGPLPATHIPPNRSFVSSQLAPFATNIQFQLLTCSSPSLAGPQIRVIINDGVVPLTGIKGCPEQKDGMCPVETFVKAHKELIQEKDWIWACHGNWSVPAGDEWSTVTGDPPGPCEASGLSGCS